MRWNEFLSRALGTVAAMGASLAVAWPCHAGQPEDLWRTGLALAEDPSVAIQRMDELVEFLPMWATQLEVDPETLDLLRDLRQRSVELNLKALYETLPVVEVDEGRSVQMLGLNRAPVAYVLSLFPERAPGATASLGTYEGSLRMTPSEVAKKRGHAYAMRQQGVLGTGGIAQGDAMRFSREFLDGLVYAATTPAPPPAQVAARAAHGGAGGEVDQALLASVHASAPTTALNVSRLFSVDRVARFVDDPAGGEPVLVLDMAGTVRDLADAGYPHLGAYLEDLGRLADVRMVVADRQGACLLEARASSRTLSASAKLMTRDGAIVPYGCQDDVPVVSRALDPAAFGDVTVAVLLEGDLRYEGVVVELSDYWIPVRLRDEGGSLSARAVVRAVPEIDIRGDNALTAWAVNLASGALDLEGQAQAIFDAMAAGPEHRDGSAVLIRYADTAGGAIHMDVDTQLLDNFFIRFGFRVVGGALAPTDEVIFDVRSVMGDVFLAIKKDYAGIRDAIAP